MNLLLVEDDNHLGRILKQQFEQKEIHVILCENGKQAVEQIYRGDPIDLIILDWMLPDISGIDILNQMYFDKISIPTIMLTALDTLQNKTAAFSQGADDYVVKPFEFEELYARVQALYRRTQSIPTFHYTYGDISYHISEKIIQCGDKQVQLTNRESDVFEQLLKKAGQVVSQDDILSAIWGTTLQIGIGNVLNYIYFLRNRLKHINSAVEIKSVYGNGYRLTYKNDI